MIPDFDYTKRLFLLRALLLFVVSCPLLGGTLSAQIPQVEKSGDEPVAESSPTASPTPNPTPIEVSDINNRAEQSRQQIDNLQKSLTLNPSISNIEKSLPELRQNIDKKSNESKSMLSARPSLETLRTVEQDWQSVAGSLPAWKKDLKSAIDILDISLSELKALKTEWQLTLDSLEKPSGSAEKDGQSGTESPAEVGRVEVPKELIDTVKSILALIGETEKKVKSRRTNVLSLQTQVSEQDSRVNEITKSIGELREEALSQLFVRDSSPIWASSASASSFDDLFSKAGDSFRAQFDEIRQYLSERPESVVFHVLVFLVFVGILFWAKNRLRPLVVADAELKPAFSVFQLPIAGSLVLAVMLSGHFYPQAPRMFMAILGAAALIPGVLYLRKILEKPLFPVLNVLVILYFVDLFRQITLTLPLLTRLIFTVELIAAIAFLVWFLRARVSTDSNEDEQEYEAVFLLVRKAAPFLIGLFSVALLANVIGYVSLANTIGNSVLASSYTALILYTTVQILNSLTIFALKVRPLSNLGMVRNHESLVKTKFFAILKWFGIITWVLLTLNLFSIRQNLFGYLRDILSYELNIGSVSFTAGDIIIFGFTVWLSFAISRLVRFVLREDIYPRVNLGGGVPYAISTILHYVLLLAGVLFAIAAIGIDLTNFTILAGAFGVGLGFGMQAIVNNFVSGLILLFERPIKVDDFVQVGEHQGELKRIGLRASVLRTLDGSEVILPNGQLISEEVTNWTFSDQERRLEINVGVAYGTDPREVMELLDKVGHENEDIMDEPSPRSIFIGFGESSLDFQLRAWTNKSDQWVVVRSDLTLAIHDVLTEAGIEIPFPQRVVHLNKEDETKAAVPND